MSTRVPASPLCGLLPWDSEFFHCRIARIHGDTLNEAQMLAVEEWSRSQQVQALYFLARVGCLTTVRTAQNHQFDLVDIRVTFERKMPKKDDQAVSQPGPGAVIRPARPQDVPGLQAIARAAHRDTRFFSDPHFPRALAESLYSTWISLECRGRAQQVLVAASPADEALGYVSCHFESSGGAGQIGLVGVSEKARGRGNAKNLVLAALQWFASQGAKEVTVVTQGKNIAALRLYQSCGFLIRDLQLWYHKWFSTPEARDG